MDENVNSSQESLEDLEKEFEVWLRSNFPNVPMTKEQEGLLSYLRWKTRLQEFQDREYNNTIQNYQKHVRITKIFKAKAFELLEAEEKDEQGIKSLKRIAYFFDIEETELAKEEPLAVTQRVRQPQEQGWEYFFSGQFLVTSGIQSSLTAEEIKAIYFDVQQRVKEQNGIDYLMVYSHPVTGQKLFFIDQLNKEMIASGGYDPEYNHCTLMLAEEY